MQKMSTLSWWIRKNFGMLNHEVFSDWWKGYQLLNSLSSLFLPPSDFNRSKVDQFTHRRGNMPRKSHEYTNQLKISKCLLTMLMHLKMLFCFHEIFFRFFFLFLDLFLSALWCTKELNRVFDFSMLSIGKCSEMDYGETSWIDLQISLFKFRSCLKYNILFMNKYSGLETIKYIL